MLLNTLDVFFLYEKGKVKFVLDGNFLVTTLFAGFFKCGGGTEN